MRAHMHTYMHVHSAEQKMGEMLSYLLLPTSYFLLPTSYCLLPTCYMHVHSAEQKMVEMLTRRHVTVVRLMTQEAGRDDRQVRK